MRILAACLLLASCHARQFPSDRLPRTPASELYGELRETDQKAQSLAAAPSPDCARQCDLTARICELSARICALQEKYPEDERIPGLCADGTARCDRARERVRDSCACALAPGGSRGN